MDDYVSRVLGGGVNNRWTTRLKPTEDWLKGRRKSRKFREFKKRLLGPTMYKPVALGSMSAAKREN